VSNLWENILLTLKGVKSCPFFLVRCQFFGQNCSLPFSSRSLDIPALLKSWQKHYYCIIQLIESLLLACNNFEQNTLDLSVDKCFISPLLPNLVIQFQFLALGTHWGLIHILDHMGYNIRDKELAVVSCQLILTKFYHTMGKLTK
jgi:hypothetical protein